MKYKFLRDALDCKAGDVKEINPGIADALLRMGVVIEALEKEKKSKAE